MKNSKLERPPEESGDSAKLSNQPDTPEPLPESEPIAPVEVGGPKGPEPTRYGDWEKAGRCSDF